MREARRPISGSLSHRLFGAMAGSYGDRGALWDRAIEVYDQHLHEMPAGYGVQRLLEVGVELGLVTRHSDGSWLVVAQIDAESR